MLEKHGPNPRLWAAGSLIRGFNILPDQTEAFPHAKACGHPACKVKSSPLRSSPASCIRRGSLWIFGGSHMLKKVAASGPRLLLAAKQEMALLYQKKLRRSQWCSVEAISYVYASEHRHSLSMYDEGSVEIMYYSVYTETQKDWPEKLFADFSPDSLISSNVRAKALNSNCKLAAITCAWRQVCSMFSAFQSTDKCNCCRL